MLMAELAELSQFKPVRMGLFIFKSNIIPLFAFCASQCYLIPHSFTPPGSWYFIKVKQYLIYHKTFLKSSNKIQARDAVS